MHCSMEKNTEVEDFSCEQRVERVEEAEQAGRFESEPCLSSLDSAVFDSAVLALQTKRHTVHTASQRTLKERSSDDSLTEDCTDVFKKKETLENVSSCHAEKAEQSKLSSHDDKEILDSNFSIFEMQEKTAIFIRSDQINMSQEAHNETCGDSEGTSVEHIADGGVSESPRYTVTSKPVTSSPRHWAPPKGFWRVVRPETLPLNSERISTLANPVDGPTIPEDGPKQKAKLKTVGAIVHKELQRSDSLESAFRRCLQKNTEAAEAGGGLWKADSWETVCSKGPLPLTKKVDMNNEISSSMNPEGQGQPQKRPNRDFPVFDWDSVIAEESVLSYRPLISTAEVTLSPRHEQAKRLLERARFKARTQNSKSEIHTCLGENEDMELLPVSLLLTAKEGVSPLATLDIRGRNHERGLRFRRYGQSPTRVRFEDESEKEAERRYLERVRERGPVMVGKSHSVQQMKAEPTYCIADASRETAINWVNVGFPVAILTKDGECLTAVVPKEELLRTCEACGSLLGSSQTKDPHPKSEPCRVDSIENQVPRWVSSAPTNWQTTPGFVEEITFSGRLNLVESVKREGAGCAGESRSTFGKLRRRSRKGESRVETSSGPYARSQDQWAQRRNSKTKSLLDDKTTTSKAMQIPTNAFGETGDNLLKANCISSAVDSPRQLPIKSALKSGTKSRLAGQRVVKLLPSVQYRLIHLDNKIDGSLENVQPDEHLSVSLSASGQIHPVTSGLTPCSRPSTLKYSTSLLTNDLQALTIWDPSGDSATGHLSNERVCRDLPPECRTLSRVDAKSKSDDLRAELLRAEHRKAEIHWDDSLAVSRVREGKSKLSLRRFFSAMGLNSVGKLVKGSRSNSMEHLCSPTGRYSSATSSPIHFVPLQRTPSLQSLHTESPLAQIRKASSVQSLQSPKRRFERSTILGEIQLPLCLGPRDLQAEEGLDEDPRGSGPVGRLVQAFPDGTLMIELIRPVNNGPFGFVISRGKGRPDSGVYVDRVGDGPSDNIYTGLLGVGDEILEVNGEIIAGLSLDQVTRLMTRDSKATVRIRPHSWIKH